MLTSKLAQLSDNVGYVMRQKLSASLPNWEILLKSWKLWYNQENFSMEGTLSSVVFCFVFYCSITLCHQECS